MQNRSRSGLLNTLCSQSHTNITSGYVLSQWFTLKRYWIRLSKLVVEVNDAHVEGKTGGIVVAGSWKKVLSIINLIYLRNAFQWEYNFILALDYRSCDINIDWVDV